MRVAVDDCRASRMQLPRQRFSSKPYLEALRVRSSVGHQVELQRNDSTTLSKWGRYVNPKGGEAGGRRGGASQVPRSTRFSIQHDAQASRHQCLRHSALTNICEALANTLGSWQWRYSAVDTD